MHIPLHHLPQTTARYKLHHMHACRLNAVPAIATQPEHALASHDQHIGDSTARDAVGLQPQIASSQGLYCKL